MCLKITKCCSLFIIVDVDVCHPTYDAMHLECALEISSAQAEREVDRCHQQHMARVYLYSCRHWVTVKSPVVSTVYRVFLSRVLFSFV